MEPVPEQYSNLYQVAIVSRYLQIVPDANLVLGFCI